MAGWIQIPFVTNGMMSLIWLEPLGSFESLHLCLVCFKVGPDTGEI